MKLMMASLLFMTLFINSYAGQTTFNDDASMVIASSEERGCSEEDPFTIDKDQNTTEPNCS